MIHWLELLTSSYGLHQQISNWTNFPWFCAPQGLLTCVDSSFFTLETISTQGPLTWLFWSFWPFHTVLKSPDSGESTCPPPAPAVYCPLLVRVQNFNQTLFPLLLFSVESFPLGLYLMSLNTSWYPVRLTLILTLFCLLISFLGGIRPRILQWRSRNRDPVKQHFYLFGYRWKHRRRQTADVSVVKRRQLLLQLRQDGQRRAAAGVQQRAEKPPPHPGEHVAAETRGVQTWSNLNRIKYVKKIRSNREIKWEYQGSSPLNCSAVQPPPSLTATILLLVRRRWTVSATPTRSTCRAEKGEGLTSTNPRERRRVCTQWTGVL